MGQNNQLIYFYEGELLNDQPHGQGKEQNNDGWEYEGLYQRGKKGPSGKQVRQDGCVYEGEFKNDVFHGHGKLTNPASNSCYEGQWQNGKMHG